MARSFTLAAACLVALVAAATTDTVVPPRGFHVVKKAAATGTIDLFVAIKLQKTEQLNDALWRVADPQSPAYAQHLSQGAVDALLRPSEASVASVLSWLAESGIAVVRLTHNNAYARATVTVAQAEALLSAQYFDFEHDTAANFSVRRCRQYTLPAAVREHVDFVAPTTSFPAPHALHAVRRHSAGAPEAGVTPSLIRSMYGVGNDSSTQPANKQQAAGFLGEFASKSDLESFFGQFFPQAQGNAVTIVGPNDEANPGLEADLDVQYIMSLGLGVNTTYWYTAGEQPFQNEPFLIWLQALSALPDTEVPRVVSVSYGDDEDTIDPAYAARVNVEFQALGARGVSLLYSSGDGGVAGSQPSSCPAGFIPTFPAASPYVTAVGATDRPGAEVAAGFSGGGFSNFFPLPEYQSAAVAAYFKAAGGSLPAPGLYNASGAGFPDVAAIGTNFNIVCGGSASMVDGTSCSSPTFGGMVSLLNDHRLAAGKGTLGWLNPLMYGHPEVFADITSGNNPGCGTQGFYATAGWDPVTGLGTLKYPAALALVLSLP